MKRRLILLGVEIALLAGFGAVLHSPPSIVDSVTGATPKAKKAAQESAQLEGKYIFCMNSSVTELSEKKVRDDLKAFVSGQKDTIRTDTEQALDIYVSKTDYALDRYVDSLCDRLCKAGINAEKRKYSSTMLRSRAVSGRYEVFLASDDQISTDSLENADYIILDSTKMRSVVK